MVFSAAGINSLADCNTGLDYKSSIMRTYILLLLGFFEVSSAFTQHVRLNVYGNYVFDDQVESFYSTTNYFHGVIKGDAMWGTGIEFRTYEEYGLELLYMRQDTKADVHYYDLASVGDRDGEIDLAINWIQVAATRYLVTKRMVEPYGGLMLGVAVLKGTNPENQVSESATKFGWGIRLGTNIWLTDRLGLKLQTQFLCATQAAGGSLYFGTGGSGAAVTTYSTMAQFVLGGGLTFRLGSTDPRPTRKP
jgi:hypothetical protein